MSSDTTTPNQERLARNTVVLYVRTVLMLVISLYTSRVVLRVLGVDDFAIYSIIGNFVATFSIVTATLTMASQRFITVEIGRGSETDIRRTFNTSLNLHLIMAVLLIIVCEVIGLWYINEKMVLPTARIEAAQVVFHCSLIAFLFQFISIPYTSLIIAYEHMGAWAWISIVEVLLKLGGAIALLLLPVGYDNLVWYAIFLVVAAIVVRIIYGIYCNYKFPFCAYQWKIDVSQMHQMSAFMGWNVLGTGADIMSKQCITLLLNAFFALSVNAARGIAIQVESAVTNFTRQISMAFNPQITKSFAKEEYKRANQLVCQGAKLGFFFFLVVAIPLIVETPAILKGWLDRYPGYTVTFVRLSLMCNMILSLSYTIDAWIFASGKIRSLQIWTAILLTACFPISYISFRMGLPPYYCYLALMLMTTALLVVKIHIASRLVPAQFVGFYDMIIKKCLPTTMLSIVFPLFMHYMIQNSSYATSLTVVLGCCLLYVIWSVGVIATIGLDRKERKKMFQYIHKRICPQ